MVMKRFIEQALLENLRKKKYLIKWKNRRMKREYQERRRGQSCRQIWRKKCGTAVCWDW